VRVAGKRVDVFRRGGRLRAFVDLRGHPRGAVKVVVTGRDAAGRAIRQTRRYHPCTRHTP
jgi:hypothetical protein